MDQFDPGQNDISSLLRLELEHQPDAAFDPSMVLLDSVVEIFARPDRDRFLFIPAISALQPVGRITGKDCFPICLAAIDDDAIRAAMTVESLVEEQLCRSKIAVFAEEKLDRIANAVDRPVEVHPFAPDFDVCLVDMPFVGHSAFAPVEPFKQ